MATITNDTDDRAQLAEIIRKLQEQLITASDAKDQMERLIEAVEEITN